MHARNVFGVKGKKVNTYVELVCGDESYQSKIMKKTTNPEWNEYFRFYVNNYEKDVLRLKLIDAKQERTIAKVNLPVKDFVDKNRKTEVYDIDDDIKLDLDVQYESGGAKSV